MGWQELSENWILAPAYPQGVIHFLGGAFVATAPQVTYRLLLEELYHQGYLIIASPFASGLDHQTIAETVLLRFERAMERLRRQDRLPHSLPVYGLGHSMGCKLHLLIGSLAGVERAGNILMAYNNYSARRSIPFMDQLSSFMPDSVLPGEFSPSPEETVDIIADRYQVRRNLLIRFRNDDLDQSRDLIPVLQSRCSHLLALQRLQGNHLTPLGQDLNWKIQGSFSPVDAIGQWFKQEIYRDFQGLKQEILRWLNPLQF